MSSGSLPERDRRAGILLHLSSLPGPYGIGDMGPEARRFLTWLEAAQQRIWQTLPVNPTDDTGSPYASPSAFARNPMLIAIDDLVDDGWLTHGEKPFGAGSPYRVDHAAVGHAKGKALAKAADRVRATVDLSAWSAENRWVEDWALFAALVQEHGGRWTTWPEALAHRDGTALAAARDAHADAIGRHTALQWLFAQQWAHLRSEADKRGIALWGDIPYFVGGESCDVWAHRTLFRLDGAGRPTVVTGVPPDAFSADGQCWGTPHYDLEAHKATEYAWWRARLGRTLELFHEVRLDHFRGFAGVWEIPNGAKATEGRWVDSFGADLLTSLRNHLGGLPLIAEDLGIITPDVEALRDGFGLPGMVILQFAFEGGITDGTHAYLPHNHRPRQVVYPGTHDNATTVGWYQSADEATRDHVRRYLSTSADQPAGDFVRAAYRSVAADAVVTLQDALGYGDEARMNTPGTIVGNWAWRAGPDATNMETAGWLATEARLTGRAR
jgi:4-alpha-glucanotransferase